MTAMPKRERAWKTLSDYLDRGHLASMSSIEPMSALPRLAEEIVAGRIRGRVVIDVTRQ